MYANCIKLNAEVRLKGRKASDINAEKTHNRLHVASLLAAEQD